MQRLYVEISEEAFLRLMRIALQEYRGTREHAAVLLEQALGCRGDEPTEPLTETEE